MLETRVWGTVANLRVGYDCKCQTALLWILKTRLGSLGGCKIKERRVQAQLGYAKASNIFLSIAGTTQEVILSSVHSKSSTFSRDLISTYKLWFTTCKLFSASIVYKLFSPRVWAFVSLHGSKDSSTSLVSTPSRRLSISLISHPIHVYPYQTCIGLWGSWTL